MNLERHRSVEETSPRERIDFRWVTGDKGAVSMWFANTKPILGYSVPGPIVVHSRRAADVDGHGPCVFLDRQPCWMVSNRLLPTFPTRWQDHPVVVAYDRADDEALYRWLGGVYIEHFETGDRTSC